MKPRLKEIIFSITSRCNLRCAMCQIHDGSSEHEELGFEEAKALIADATALFPSAVVFSGGEPLLRKDLFELIAFAGRLHLNTCLTSNGTLLDDAAAVRLAQARIGVVNISIEGPEDVHEALRGKGHYRPALQALQHLARHQIEATIATTVCRQNYRFLPEVMKLASEEGVTTVKFQPFSPIFLKEKAKARDFSMPTESRREFEDIIERVLEWANTHKITTNPAAYLRSMPAHLCGSEPNPAPVSCAALWTSCPISAGGNVHPCWVFADKVLGNVKKNRLSRIWNSRSHDRVRRHLLDHECRGCFMSCYDSNFDKDGWARSFLVRAHKLKRPRFYQRVYFRSYQYARYIRGKVVRRFFGSRSSGQQPGTFRSEELLGSIRKARHALESRLKCLK